LRDRKEGKGERIKEQKSEVGSQRSEGQELGIRKEKRGYRLKAQGNRK
jgi:hypothetical protein